MAIPVTRRQVLDSRLRAQQLDRDSGIVVDTAVLGVLVDGEIAGTRGPGRPVRRLRRALGAASPAMRTAIGEQAERLAAFRELQLSGVEVTD